MPISLTMPRLSDTMEAGTVIKWNVKEGDKVRSGDIVADIETDKATMEMQCFDDGTIAKLLVEPGKQVKVGTPIAVIAAKGEDPSSVGVPTSGAPAAAPAPKAAAPAATSSVPVTPVRPAAPATPSAPATPRASDASADADGPRMRVSPVARRMAEGEGIDLSSVRGSGPNGRIIKRDILAASANKSAAGASIDTGTKLALRQPAVVAGAPSLFGNGPGERIVALSGMRQTIARRLVESKTSIPHYQVTMRFAMDALMAKRAEMNDAIAALAPDAGVKLSVNDFIVRASAIAMAKHPYMNASFGGDHIAVHGEVNVGVAISLPEERGGGLVVGVIRNADRKSLRQISQESKFLAEKARTKGLSMDEMSGSTFTISNLGMFGVEHFTAIINPPNSAILACGAAVEQPVVRNHQLAVGWEMQATLSLDHRVIDGAMAAEYLKTLKSLLETPASLTV
jgi:pyruvate dehydrogenase E2 component (dihydrolipoamide acetyltransferase)